MSFKKDFDFEKRAQESKKVRNKFANNDSNEVGRIPVIVEKVGKSDLPDINRKKFLVPSDLTMGQFIFIIRKKIQLPAEKAIYLFVNGKIPPSSALIAKIDDENKDDDGFLYVSYSGEKTFGA
jgi:GABA(A) receptor-associated protein